MNKKNALQYIILASFYCIPCPARLGYGLILLLVFNILVLVLTCTKYLLIKAKLEKYSKILQIIIAVAITVFCNQLLSLYSPLHSLVLGNILYIIPVSSIFGGLIIRKRKLLLAAELKLSMSRAGVFTLLSLVYFCVREYLAYGTLSFPSHTGFYISTLPSFNIGVGIFWASVPGAFVLFAIFIIIMSIIYRYKEIKWRSENNNA
ncbi:MAG: hypothetical protein BKP49_01730 [Treponema sp. CETP13]|nr:MAG: hypothetical protein BKP49_01730 [Treponema sp. CETP13]